ncbi:MAG: hypothetical protein LBU86_02035 [Oscillospiraceae bacterium]|nr:hypothetical protein [Oscillospiraceae bacterium]
MKTTFKALTLMLLMAIMLASTCITVMAAEDVPPAIEGRSARFGGYAAEALPEDETLEDRAAEDGAEATDPELAMEDRVGINGAEATDPELAMEDRVGINGAEAADPELAIEDRVGTDGAEAADPGLEERAAEVEGAENAPLAGGEVSPFSAEPFAGIARSRVADPVGDTEDSDYDTFGSDGDMVLFSRGYASGGYYDDGTRLSGNATGDIEDAPAFWDSRGNRGLETPPLVVSGEEEDDGWGETNYDDVESDNYSPAPDTGAVSFAGSFMAGLVLIGCAALAAKKGKEGLAE